MTPLPPHAKTPADVLSGCRRVILANLDFVLRRWEEKGRPPYLDTKVNLATGRDFAVPEARGTVFGADVCYGWIQGRGLEALAGHLAWLAQEAGAGREAAAGLRSRTRACLEAVGASLEALRRRCGGRLSFMMDPASGTALSVDPAGGLRPLPDAGHRPPGFTDLFYFKGLASAGHALGKSSWRDEGVRHFRETVSAVLAGEFASDQQPMDPKNPVGHVPGRITHGPLMIAVGGCGTLLAATGDRAWWDLGVALMRAIVARHVSRGRFPGIEDGAFVEFITPEGDAYDSGGAILCDPGHALEFVGLACRLVRIGAATLPDPEEAASLARAHEAVLPAVFRHAFDIGFDPEGGGIRKLLDLRSGGPVNSDMPWWSLPETMRAAALLGRLYPETCAADCTDTLLRCWNAYRAYLNPRLGLMAVQTRDQAGNVAAVIPACPDADPCYHTGLSLVDVCTAMASARTDDALENGSG